jgi:hypothetical protein
MLMMNAVLALGTNLPALPLLAEGLVLAPVGFPTIGGVELRLRHVRSSQAPEILDLEIPGVGVTIVPDMICNRGHVVVSRQTDNWTGAFGDVEKRGAVAPLILAGHGEPASPTEPGPVGCLEAVRPLLAANMGKSDQAKAIRDDLAKAFPTFQQPALLTLDLSLALQS